MGIDCGSQIILCDVPIRLDTYLGCSHGCKYCFVKRKNSELDKISVKKSVDRLVEFINGKRGSTTNWCDWQIPLHWGGLSDPFQPIEKKYKESLECLKKLAETKYPFIVSTKGALIAEEPYLSLLEECECVVQFSMVCSKYDILEPGAPTFEERLDMVRRVSSKVKRVIVRIQPYMLEVFDDVMLNIPRFKEAGAFGITVEGMKFLVNKPGLVKVKGDWCYPVKKLKNDFVKLRSKCREVGLAFYSAENRLRRMGSSLCCCGVDGMGWKTNTFNVMHFINGDIQNATECMKQLGTSQCFKALFQDKPSTQLVKENSFESMMMKFVKLEMKKRDWI